MSYRITLMGNGTGLNRGCEAILLGTVEILRRTFGAVEILNIPNWQPHPGAQYRSCEVCGGISYAERPHVFSRRLTPSWGIDKLVARLPLRAGAWWHYHRWRATIDQSDAVLALGGDNFTLDYGIPWMPLMQASYVRSQAKPFILWAASVGPFEQEPWIHDLLRASSSGILVREDRTFDYLKDHGYTNLHRMGDPAFMMPAKAVSEGRLGFTLPAGALAVNISPVLLRFLPNTTYDQFVDRCAGCISAFLVAFKRPIVLVYHVMKPGNDDRALLEAALQRVPLARGQVQLLPKGLSAPELKWVISQCDCLVAARTHATIAAFSTFTPTVSIAYSPKAYGINEELFGHTRYVLPFDELDPDRLVAITRLVLTEANHIRERLHRSIPEMRKRACHGGECLRAMLDARGDLP